MPRPIRLGDVLDDYCPRCRLVLNHGVVGMVAEEIKKVRCQTCHNEHTYRQGKEPKRRKGGVESLFEQVLKGMPRSSPPSGASPPPPKAERPPGKKDGSRDGEP